MSTRTRLTFLCTVLLLSFSPTEAPLLAGTARKCNLLKLRRSAGAIFYGRCTEKREFPDAEPVPYVEYTFTVLHAVKGVSDKDGKPQETFTFRHARNRRTRQRADGSRVVPVRWGLPEYETGQELVLFLTRESRLGLCAPVGLGQGTFRVGRWKGRRRVKGALCGRELFKGLKPSKLTGFDDKQLKRLSNQEDAFDLEIFLGVLRSMKE